MNYSLPWLFYFSYHKNNENSLIKYAPSYVEKHQLPNEQELLDISKLTTYIHKYDLKKLDYFSNSEEECFDTLFRFKFSDSKKYTRTHAICKKTKDGIDCLMFDAIEVMKMKYLIKKTKVYPTQTTMDLNVREQDLPNLIKDKYKMINQMLSVVDREV